MIPVSTEYRQQLIAGNRNWVVSIPVFLKGNTSGTPDFTLTNENVWENGVVLDEAISSDTSFDLGSAIVGSLKVIIDNINGDFSQYDFFDARLTLWLGVEGDVDEYDNQRLYRIGFFVVDVPSYNGSLITLNCLDNMIWFDTPFKDVTGINWSNATAGSIVQKICQHVGVSLANPSFPNYTIAISAQPEQDMTCRDVLQYIAQMCCCYCKIDRAGHLYLNWYDKNAIIGMIDYDGGTYNTNTTPYSDGCDLDGGWFHYGGDNADGGTFEQLLDRAFISQNYEIEVSTDDVVITGCRVRSNRSKESAYDVTWVDPTVEANHDRYILVIDDNPFIHTATKANEIANIVGQTLAGLPMRGFTSSSLADFSNETGDMATVVDFRGNRYYTWITHFTFTTGESESFSCGVQSVKKRGEQRFSTLAETIEKAKVAITAYDAAVKEMDVLAQNAIGYNEYVQNVGGSSIMYRYNGSSHTTSVPPKFQGSTVVFKISGDGVFVAKGSDIAPDGTCTFSNGYDANTGTGILNLLYVRGLNADWINAGQISADRLTANVITSINSATGSTTISGGKINIAGVVSGINAGSTTINGGMITTGTVDTDQLKANAVTSGKIAAGEVKASNIASNAITSAKIDAGAVTTSKLDAGAVTAAKINVDKLSSINANCGTITAGTIQGTEISGSQKFDMTADTADATHDSTLNWGGTWIDSLTVVVHNNSNGGVGVALKNNHQTRGCYMHYDDIRLYKGSSSSWYEPDWIAKTSDRRLKEKIANLDADKVRTLFKKIRPVKFKYKDWLDNQIGLIAQEFIEVLDDLGIDKSDYITVDENDYYGIEYGRLYKLSMLATHDLYEIIERQQEEIDLLKQEVELLKKKVGE